MGDHKRKSLSLKKSAIYRNIGGGAGGPSQFNCGHSLGNSIVNDSSSMVDAEGAGPGDKSGKSQKSSPLSTVNPSGVYDTSNIRVDTIGKC